MSLPRVRVTGRQMALWIVLFTMCTHQRCLRFTVRAATRFLHMAAVKMRGVPETQQIEI